MAIRKNICYLLKLYASDSKCIILKYFYKAGVTSHIVSISLFILVNKSLLTVTELQAANQDVINNNETVLLDIDNPPNGRYSYSDTLSYGSKLTFEYSGENNYDLIAGNGDDLGLQIIELEFALTYVPSEYWDAYIDLELVEEKAVEDKHETHDHETELNVKELNITNRNIMPGVILKFGRQSFKDSREWLYDEELDAIRIYYRNNGLSIETSVSCDNLFARDVLNKDERVDIFNYYVLGNYYFNNDNSIGAYFFIRDDQENNERPIWTGLKARGKNDNNAQLWIDFAYLSGRSQPNEDGEQQNINAYAFDIGGTYVFDQPMKPALTLGWAYGSGDGDSSTHGDGNFRQTGLQDNNGRFNGVTRFKYYGEMLEPELSNLAISTIGLGVRPEKKTSFDLVFHTYRQANNADTIRDSNLEIDPTGRNTDIGKAIDVIIGYRAIKDLSIELVYGRFIPGNAFDEAVEDSTLLNLKIDFKF